MAPPEQIMQKNEVELKPDSVFDELKKFDMNSINVILNSTDVQCRTCLTTCAGTEPISVSLLDSETTQTYATMLKAVTGVEAGNDDMLCVNCRHRTLDAYQFRLQARQSDAQLAGNAVVEHPLINVKVEELSDDVEFVSFEPAHSDNDNKPLLQLKPLKPKLEARPVVKFAVNECVNCKGSFKTYYKLKKHQKICKKRAPKAKFAIKPEKIEEKQNNLALDKKLKSNQCGICFNTFEDVVSLVHHVRTSHKKVIGGAEKPARKVAPKSLLTQVLKKTPVTLQTKRTLAAKRKLLISKQKLNAKQSHSRPSNIICEVRNKELLKNVTASKMLKKSEPRKRKTTEKRKNLFRCCVCMTLFDSEQRLDEHCRQHGDTEVIMCAMCSRVYLKYSQFKRHFHTHHAELTDINSAETTETILELRDTGVAEQILQHVRMTSIGDIVSAQIAPQDQAMEIEAYVQVCGLCGAVLLSPDQLKEHNATEHPDFHLRCYLCGISCASERNRSTHMFTCELRTLPHECVICGLKYTRQGYLKSHLMLKHKEYYDQLTACENYTCEFCGKTMRTKMLFTQHMYYCGPLEDCVCDVCKKTFDRKGKLRRHIQQTHGPKRSHLCATCGKSFPKAFHLQRHTYLHTGERPYKCDYCSNGFVTTHQLKYHMMKHTGAASNECDICDRKFIRPSSYRRHMMIHTGERPYRCDICNSGFIQKTCLQAHMKKHNMSHIEQGLALDPDPFNSAKPDWVCDDVKSDLESEEGSEIVMDSHSSQPASITPWRKPVKRLRREDSSRANFGYSSRKKVKRVERSLPFLD